VLKLVVTVVTVMQEILRSPNRSYVAFFESHFGSSRIEVRGRARATNELSLMDALIEPERLAQISLGQGNPRMRMNAAPG